MDPDFFLPRAALKLNVSIQTWSMVAKYVQQLWPVWPKCDCFNWTLSQEKNEHERSEKPKNVTD